VLIAKALSTGQDNIQCRNHRSFREQYPLMERRFPQFLEAVPKLGTHTRRNMTINATHAGHLVAHPLGLKDIPDA
jgi:hypothetical protein